MQHPAAWGQPLTAHQQFDMYSTFPIGHSSMQRGAATATAPVSHTQQPLVTGTSVLGLKYKDGVMLAADNLGELIPPYQADGRIVRLARALP